MAVAHVRDSTDIKQVDYGLDYDIRLGAQTWQLRTVCERSPVQPRPSAHDTRFAECRVVLRSQTQQQVLARADSAVVASGVMSYGADAQLRLLFAGDLDGDGLLDLIIDTSDHYNVSKPTLFMSSPAGDGHMLRAVAHLYSVGC